MIIYNNGFIMPYLYMYITSCSIFFPSTFPLLLLPAPHLLALLY